MSWAAVANLYQIEKQMKKIQLRDKRRKELEDKPIRPICMVFCGVMCAENEE